MACLGTTTGRNHQRSNSSLSNHSLRLSHSSRSRVNRPSNLSSNSLRLSSRSRYRRSSHSQGHSGLCTTGRLPMQNRLPV